MYIIPEPRKMKVKDGYFILEPGTRIVLDSSCQPDDLNYALLLKEHIKEKIGIDIQITRSFGCSEKKGIFLERKDDIEEGYSIEISSDVIRISGKSGMDLLYGIQTMRQVIVNSGINIPCLSIKDYPNFKYRGFYHDITRGKVPTLETLKELADRAAYYKINQLQLYIEHTFAFKNHSEVWIGADPITPEEILILDDYCRKLNIELVPSLSTFGHLYMALSSNSFNHLCELENSIDKPYSWIERMGHHTLDVSNPESLKFVQDMLDEFIPLFTSDKFNICCDETFDLGTGKSRELAEKLGKGRVYVDFLKKIIESVNRYGKKVMFWGDIILKSPELIKEIPEDAICLNWNYSSDAREDGTRTFAESGRKQYVCPGVGGWDHLMNDMDGSFSNISKMVAYGKKYGAEGVLNTDWGDYGHVNFLSNSIPGMIYGAGLSWNPESQDNLELVDRMISRTEYGDNSEKIVGLLRELSRQQMITFMEITWWKEDKFSQTMLLKGRPELKKKFMDLSEKETCKKYRRALEIGDEILALMPSVSPDRRVDINEFYISAQGIALINALYLALKKYDFKKDVEDTIFEPEELAVRFEYWFSDFSKAWRKRNKESELYRIRDTFIQICGWLRNCR